MENLRRRYETLDAWRGLAALSVLIFHCASTIVGPGSPLGGLLLYGWLGVFIFFPVSGYCILAALHSPDNRTLGAFLTRRWRRIFPPYWASIAFAILVGLAALPFNRGSLGEFILPAQTWATVLTLTQVFTDDPGRINPVYWSLCFEEQFYLVMALLLIVPARGRAPLLGLLTIAAAVYISPVWTWRVRGLFLEYWLCFSAGCGAYLWVHDRAARGWAAGFMAAAAGVGALLASLPLLASAATALAMAGLAKYDSTLARARVLAPLMAVGAFSFSLYLTHVPIGGRVTNLLERFDLPPAVIVPISAVVSLAVAWLFFLSVERHTLRSRPAAAVSGSKAPAITTRPSTSPGY